MSGRLLTSLRAEQTIQLWMQANRARRELERELQRHDLSFSLWWVLYATHRLIVDTGDAVSQRDVSLRTELDKATISYLMGVLSERGLVDRAPAFGWLSYRIWVTSKGEALLLRVRESIERAPIPAAP